MSFILTSSRVHARLPGAEDIESIVKYYSDNAERFAAWDPEPPKGFLTQEYWSRRVLEISTEYEERRSARLFLFERECPEKVIGTIGLSQIVQGFFHACYLGYGLAGSAEGKGLMSEALALVIRHAFGPMNLHRLMANYQPHNVRSAALLKRHGFVIEGHAKDYLFFGGQWRDHVLTSLTHSDWKTPATAV